MSQENVDAFERAVAAWNRHDVDGMLEEFHPDVEWHGVFQVMFGGDATVSKGHDAVREYVRDLDENFAERSLDYREIRDLDDRVLLIGRVQARGRVSGAEIDAPYGILAEFRDGRAFRLRDYFDPTEAIEAAGLSE